MKPINASKTVTWNEYLLTSLGSNTRPKCVIYFFFSSYTTRTLLYLSLSLSLSLSIYLSIYLSLWVSHVRVPRKCQSTYHTNIFIWFAILSAQNLFLNSYVYTHTTPDVYTHTTPNVYTHTTPDVYTHTTPDAHLHTNSNLVEIFGKFFSPVGWRCRIHRLHLCRGGNTPPTSVLDMIPNKFW